MEPMQESATVSTRNIDEQSIELLITQLEREIGNSIPCRNGKGVSKVNHVGIKPSRGQERAFRGSGNSPDDSREIIGASSLVGVLVPRTAEKPEMSIVARILDEVDIAGEMAGFGLRLFFKNVLGFALTFVVAASFAVIVFLNGVGKGLMRKRWKASPQDIDGAEDPALVNRVRKSRVFLWRAPRPVSRCP